MEKFRGSELIIPRSKNWKEIDETDKYSKVQRQKCSQRSGRTCTLYPYPIGLKVLEMFKPKKWLDPTAGWGDRLRCAITYGCQYTGVDSNPEMQIAYKQIIEDSSIKEKCEVLYGKFQDVQIKGKYDLVFTSPPFYTKEKYEGMVEWKDIEEFLNEFLKPLFDKSIKHLSKNGHIVLYIEDKGTDAFIDLMKGYAEELPLIYEGAFYYEARTPRPYYVWKRK
jgi:tRNA1(Val) A37 N6-methylase TrmN6